MSLPSKTNPASSCRSTSRSMGMWFPMGEPGIKDSPGEMVLFCHQFLPRVPFGAVLVWCLWQKVSYTSFLIFLAEDIQLLCVHGENIERRKWSSTGESKSPSYLLLPIGSVALEITVSLDLFGPLPKCPVPHITDLHLYSIPFAVIMGWICIWEFCIAMERLFHLLCVGPSIRNKKAEAELVPSCSISH